MTGERWKRGRLHLWMEISPLADKGRPIKVDCSACSAPCLACFEWTRRACRRGGSGRMQCNAFCLSSLPGLFCLEVDICINQHLTLNVDVVLCSVGLIDT